MLQEGHSLVAEGGDVAIGLLETHDRAATAAMAEGLELIPRRSVPFRSTVLEEMDLHLDVLREIALLQVVEEVEPTGSRPRCSITRTG